MASGSITRSVAEASPVFTSLAVRSSLKDWKKSPPASPSSVRPRLWIAFTLVIKSNASLSTSPITSTAAKYADARPCAAPPSTRRVSSFSPRGSRKNSNSLLFCSTPISFTLSLVTSGGPFGLSPRMTLAAPRASRATLTSTYSFNLSIKLSLASRSELLAFAWLPEASCLFTRCSSTVKIFTSSSMCSVCVNRPPFISSRRECNCLKLSETSFACSIATVRPIRSAGSLATSCRPSKNRPMALPRLASPGKRMFSTWDAAEANAEADSEYAVELRTLLRRNSSNARLMVPMRTPIPVP